MFLLILSAKVTLSPLKNKNFVICFAFPPLIRIFAPSYQSSKLHSNMFGIGTQELLVIALIVLLLFGGKKIPELMKGLGKGVKSFKEGVNGLDDIDDEAKKKKDEDKQE